MKAVVHDRYGPPEVLRLADVPPPVPGAGDVLVRVHAASMNRTDCHRRAADPWPWRLLAGIRRPRLRVLGNEYAGEVEQVGAGVTAFRPGDRVFGYNPRTLGSHAELVCVRADGLIAHLPGGTAYQQGVVLDGALTALYGLRAGGLRQGQDLLVYGASGSIGTAAVQLGARHFGAHVTGVCDTPNVELVRSLGADLVIDYLHDDFTAGDERYDVIFDAVGVRRFRECRGSLRPGGTFLSTDNVENILLSGWTRAFGDRRVVLPIPRGHSPEDVHLVGQLMASGKYRAVVDRSYPLEQVTEAARYVETGRKTGNVVLTID
jgi:NADPH:quinone reductase-like Zn-dependent oxidoreductase